MEPKRPSAERKLVAPPAKGPAVLRLPDPEGLPPPYADERLVEPETRQEMVRGLLIHAVPANPEHGDEHFEVDYLARGYLAPGYTGSTDLLTRAGLGSDFATDTCIRRSGIDPRTGSRYLEEVAFEVVNTQTLAHMVDRAHELTSKGVRRIFAIFVKRREVGEWSAAQRRFVPLDLDAAIEDRTLVRPLPVRALFDTAVADDSLVDALEAKQTPRLVEKLAKSHDDGRTEGLAEGRDEGRAETFALAIETVCDLLRIPLGPREHHSMNAMSANARAALFAYLKTEHRWPSD